MKLIADLSKGTLAADGETFSISNKVRTLKAGTRKSYEVIRSIPGDRPYDPHQFPKGVWNVTGIEWQKEKGFDPNTYGPVKIRTDAWQRVEVWKLDDNGDYAECTCEQVKDFGYLLHYSTSSTTLGCIRLNSAKDAKEVAGIIQRSFDREEPVSLEVL